MSDEQPVLEGHDATDIAPPPTPAEPVQQQEELEEVTVDGATYKVPAAVSAALRAAKTPTPVPSKAPEPAPAAKTEDSLSVIWYTNPEKAAKLIEERTYARVAKAYQQEKAAERFWNDFETRHPDLKPAKRLAQKLLQTEPKFRNMDDETGLKTLADDTRALLREAVPGREPAKPVILEGGTRSPHQDTKSPAPTEAQEPQTLSDWIRADRARRQDARRKFKQGA